MGEGRSSIGQHIGVPGSVWSSESEASLQVGFRWDEEGNWTEIGSGWSDLSSVPITEAIGRPISEWIDPKHHTEFEAAFELLRTGGEAHVIRRLQWRDPRGHTRTIDLFLRAETSARQGTARGEGWIRDVTELAAVLGDLQRERDFVEGVLSTAGSIIVVLDREGRIVRFNRAAEIATGYSFNEIKGEHFEFLLPEEERIEVLKSFDRQLSDGLISETSNRIRTKDGSDRWVNWSTSSLRDELGRVDHVISVGLDITESRQVEKALQESRLRYERCVAAQNDGIWDEDQITGEFYFSPRWFSMLGYEPGDLPMEPGLFRKLLHPEDVAKINAAHEAHARHGTPFEAEVRLRTKGGGYRWILTRGAGQFDESGRLTRMIGSHTDIHDRKLAERALAASEARLAEASRLAKLGWWRFDILSGVMDWSPELFKIFGISDKNGAPSLSDIVEFAHIDDQDSVWETVQHLMNGGETMQIRFRACRSNGEIIIVDAVGRTERSADGIPVALVGAAQDVTEQASAEADLRRTRDILVESQRVARLGTWEIDIPTRRVNWTPETLSLPATLHLPREMTYEEFVGLSIPEDRDRIRSAFAQSIAGGSEFEFDFRIAGAAQKYVLRILAKPILGEGGEVRRLIGCVQDVSEAREAARQIANQRAFLRRVIDGSPNLIFVKDARGRFVLANSKVASVYGRSPEELIGKRDADFSTNPEEVEQFEVSDQIAIQAIHEKVTREELVTDFSGQSRWYHTVKQPIVSPETGETQVLGICVDITDRVESQEELVKARESAIESSRLKSEFIANLGHEIRTPMNGLLGMADLLLDTDLTSEQVELAKTIRGCGENLMILMNDLLDFSKVESGKMTVEWAKVDVVAIVEEVAGLFSAAAIEKDLDLNLEIDWTRSWFLRTDAGRLRQVLSNLVGNAIKFTFRGGVTIGVGPEPEGGLRIEVRDTGIGIPPDRQEAIFDSFVQGDGSTTRRFGGTGLGLTISRQLSELMGGTIGLTSQPGVGSTFRIDFPSESLLFAAAKRGLEGLRVFLSETAAPLRGPLVASGAVITSSEPEVSFGVESDNLTDPWVAILHRGQVRPARAAAVIFHPVTRRALLEAVNRIRRPEGAFATAIEKRSKDVLLADDNSLNISLLARTIEGLGLRVDVARSTHELLELVGRVTYSLILFGVDMADHSGSEAVATVRLRDRESGHRTHIVGLTVESTEKDRERYRSEGIDDTLNKPISKEELMERLKEWLPEKVMEANQIDLSYLREISGDDEEFQKEVIAAYAEALPTLLEELADAVEKGDRDRACRAAHTLKGSSRSIGANPFANICEVAEQSAKNGDLTVVAEEIIRRAPALLSQCELLMAA